VDFPIIDLMDEDACYATGVEELHPEGMACPRCGRNDRMVVPGGDRPSDGPLSVMAVIVLSFQNFLQ